jgi:pimeloyl-ACP methyl ester carboxylesterase
MGFLTTRITAVAGYLSERISFGIPEQAGTPDREVLFVVDGVGGFQFAPALVRRALRQAGSSLCTILFDWQFGLTGEIWTDLMWLRRNRVMGAKFARKLLAFRRSRPDIRIHVLAASGGAGIAVFACEALRGRPLVDSLVLACPALSPEYNLAPALRAVRRCYAMVSEKDRFILGLGTTVFGTTDRRFCSAAGCVGFRLPPGADNAVRECYRRLYQIRWTPELRRDGHPGSHTSWASVRFVRRHLLPILRGEPLLPARPIIDDG